MEVGKLELFVGGMFADKSTNLVRQAKRHMKAGRKVVMLKPSIDNRYSSEEVVTHNGETFPAFAIPTDATITFHEYLTISKSDVVLIDEVQFFETDIFKMIEQLVYEGKIVYAAGLDMDKEGKPFSVVTHLMGRAEDVTKLQSVCSDCGNDGWVTVETKPQEGRVNVGNDYKPVCRTCSVNYIGGALV